MLTSEKIIVRQWTEKLSRGSNLRVESNRPLHNSKEYGRHWNLTQLISVSRSVMPVEQGMPLAKAELDFHEYVSAAVVWDPNNILQDI